MSISEEASKVAASTVDAFKGNPSCLAAILLAAIFALLTFYALQRDADRRQEAMTLIMQRCFPVPQEEERP